MQNNYNRNHNHDEYILYVGRFQPPHFGHMAIFDESLKQNKKVCIAIRNTMPSDTNPLKAETVKELWEKIYKDNPLVMVIIIPNISSIKYGRNVGYTVEEIKVTDSIGNISATAIRDAIQKSDDLWKRDVSPLIHKELEEYLK